MSAQTAEFDLGRVVATPGVLAAAADPVNNPTGENTGRFLAQFLARHHRGDWGDLCVEDRVANDRALAHEQRILSAYPLPDGGKLWVITEADRSATTVLLPQEY